MHKTLKRGEFAHLRKLRVKRIYSFHLPITTFTVWLLPAG